MSEHETTLACPPTYGGKLPPYWWVECSCGWQSRLVHFQHEAETLASAHSEGADA